MMNKLPIPKLLMDSDSTISLSDALQVDNKMFMYHYEDRIIL